MPLHRIRQAYARFVKNLVKHGWRALFAWLVLNLLAGLLFGAHDAIAVLRSQNLGVPWFSDELIKTLSSIIHNYADFILFFLIIPTSLALCSLALKKPFLSRVASSLLVAGVIGSLGVQVIKLAVGRPRPPMVQRGEVHAWELRGPTLKAKFRSYPSGHSATAATACTILALAFPRLALPLIFMALTVGLSRITHNYHYPTDVIAGLSYGAAIGLLAGQHLACIRSRLRRSRSGYS